MDNGKKIENQNFLMSNLRKLRVLQRAAQRKFVKGKKYEEQSSNWRKAERRVSKLHEKIRFQREDFLQKQSTILAREYSIVCAENLDIRSMVKKKDIDYKSMSREEKIEYHRMEKVRKRINDVAWGAFLQMLKYKCDTFQPVGQYFASSQECSVCKSKNEEVKDLSVRYWTCPKCGTRHNRDVNAAINIKREGLSLCGHKVSGSTMLAPRTPRL